MEILFELIFSVLFELFFGLLAAGAEYAFYRTQKRVWMWVFGLVAIGFMIWWRGAAVWTSWALAAGWLAALVYLDRRMMQTGQDAGSR